MDKNKLLSYMGAAIAVISILFAPVIGCGEMNLNGLEILQDKGTVPEVKLFIVLAIICGVLIFFLKNHTHSTASAIAGVVALLIAYLIAHSKNQGIELRVGSFLALIGFALSALANFLGMSDKNQSS